jgi:hypothetical protein
MLIIFAFVAYESWLWGIVFLLWAIPDLFSGVTYLMEPIHKKEDPVLFWTIIVVWISFAIYLLIDKFIPSILPETWQSAYYLCM